MNRRSFLRTATAFGATAAWSASRSRLSVLRPRENREAFAEGVASGDPASTSVLLWTRRSYGESTSRHVLKVELAEDVDFRKVVATAEAPIVPASDWTCRVLVGGLKSSTVYWYRFVDAQGNGSRTGRTITAPALQDDHPVRFAFISCQNVNQGAQNAYRRMIFEDGRKPASEQLQFVLHLGDFIYEMVWYPEDRPQGMYDRRLRDVVRYPHGEKIREVHVPTCIADFRAVYRAYLHDSDIQDARARWPFVNMWDNHEFSWRGWQSLEKYEVTRSAQTRKVAANQAFFEYQPARMYKPSGPSLEAFEAPIVKDAPVTEFDEDGFGTEVNNRIAVGSLRGYRTLQFGKNVHLIVTDQRSYRSEEPLDRPEAQKFVDDAFPELIPEEAIEILDGGNYYNSGNPPQSISFGGELIPNFRKDTPVQTILGAAQKKWFLETLANSTATWKIWGNTTTTIEMRIDPQNLPPGITKPWPGAGYAGSATCDHGTALAERAEIYDFVEKNGISGFATVAGDRHSFWAGLALKSPPPKKASPVGIAFATGSISAPTIQEALEHVIPKEHPLRKLYCGRMVDGRIEPTYNLTLRHGVRSCLTYDATGDIEQARAASNRDLAPHLSFVDMAGHGYALVRASNSDFITEFVCIPRPLEPAGDPAGGALLYRVRFTTPVWSRSQVNKMKTEVIEGDPKFSL